MMNAPPAYELQIWSYGHAPDEYKAMFDPPRKEGFKSFIVWERRRAPDLIIEWVSPNGVWWNLWHMAHKREIDDVTAVYLLTENVRSP